MRAVENMSSECDDKDTDKSKPAGKPKSVPTTRELEFVPLGERPPRGQARYRDPTNPFHTWSGRGKRPAWLKEYLDAGRQLAEFEIQEKED
ncbi:H-NS histone family protein [Pseudomonas paracarnis]|uniref:H-NS histone family protein n=1 Tax=Pseudomonas paracarnis TaxID=2750625 RepID=UPI002E2DD744|nr:H-NS histone family protein [Pseudomonas paracarnis]